MRSLCPNILTNKMSPCHFSPNPGSKQWQICTGCFCLEARDQMPSPVFDFNPIWNFSRNINFNLFIIERLSHKNGPVDLNWTSINFRPIKDQVSQIVFLTKKLSIFQERFLLSHERLSGWQKGCCQWRCLIIDMMSPSRITQHPSPLIGHTADNTSLCLVITVTTVDNSKWNLWLPLPPANHSLVSGSGLCQFSHYLSFSR